jgi:hypothetical protein
MTMPLFKKKPDPMSLTMKLVEAHASGDSSMIEQARQGLAPVSTMDVLHSLYQFGQILNRATLTPEQTAAIAEKVAVTAETPEMTAAVQNVGRALLIDRSQPAVTSAVNTYGPPLMNSTSNQLRQMTFMLAAVAGSVYRALDMRFNWK